MCALRYSEYENEARLHVTSKGRQKKTTRKAIYKLIRKIYALYDAIWTQKEETNFADRLFSMFGEIRFREPPFDKVHYGICNFSNWDDVCEMFSEHLPSFVSMIEFLVRQTLNFLFGEQGPLVYRWYNRCKQLDNRSTQTVVEYLCVTKKKSVERRLLLFCIFLSHTKEEINVVLQNHLEIRCELWTEMTMNEARGAYKTHARDGARSEMTNGQSVSRERFKIINVNRNGNNRNSNSEGSQSMEASIERTEHRTG